MAYPARKPEYREEQPRRNGAGSIWMWVVGILILALIAWAIWAAVDQDQTAGPEAGATISEIQGDPSGFIGEQVTVSGQVSSIVGPSSIIVGDEDADSFILVTSVQGMTDLTEDTLVEVTGTVRAFELVTFEQEFGAFEPGFEDEFLGDGIADGVEEGGPAIVASSVTVSGQQ